MSRFLFFISSLFSFSAMAQQDACAGKDPGTYVTGGKECLVYKAFGLEAAGKEPVLVLFLHGDVSNGGPADYLHQYAAQFARPGVVTVALLRPGYHDAADNRSTGSDNGRRDNYTTDNVSAVAAAIQTIGVRFQATSTLLVGHSGGAAIAGVILGKYPGLARGAILFGCPCDVPSWRRERSRKNNWTQSLSPDSFVSSVPSGTHVVAVSGDSDEVVSSRFSKAYVSSLASRGVKAEYVEIAGGKHSFSTVAASPALTQLLVSLIGDTTSSQGSTTETRK